MEPETILLLIAVMVALAFVPVAISNARRCASHATIKALGVCSLLFPPLWVAAMIWALVGKPAT